MSEATVIERHKAAIHRNDISRPVKLAIELEVLTKETSFFDYGCGHGGDIKRLKHLGYKSKGWDPYYDPKKRRVNSDIVITHIYNIVMRVRYAVRRPVRSLAPITIIGSSVDIVCGLC